MKRAISIVVLMIMLFNGAGFYMYYFFQLLEIKREMRMAVRNMKPSQLKIIRLSGEEFEHARVDDDEISIDGRMYDVAFVKNTGSDVFVYCVRDHAEENLLGFISDIISKPIDSKKPMPAQITTFLKLIYLVPSGAITHEFSGKPVPISKPYSPALKSADTRNLTPPPEIAA